MVGNQLFQDILSYSLPLIGCPESSSSEDIRVATGGSHSLLFLIGIIVQGVKVLLFFPL